MNINAQSKTRAALSALLLTFGAGAHADIKPNALISDGMVLQQQSRVKIWGTADPGESIHVQFRGQDVSTTASPDGTWLVQLDSQGAGGPFSMTLVGKNTIAFKNVLVGEVWLCTGQSNMERALHYDLRGEDAIANSANPNLHLCTVGHYAQDTPQTNAPVKWVESNPATTRNFSATAYWFGSKLQKELGVPIGIINSSYGGTTIEAWINSPVLDRLSIPKDHFSDTALARADYDQRVAKMKPIQDKYDADMAAARAAHTALPPTPAGLPGGYRGPTVLYNGMIAPIRNYMIKGMVWYQGENNGAVGRANTYRTLLPALIKLWRSDWQQGNLPFLIVQLAPYKPKVTDPNWPSGYAVVREAQRLALSEPNTALQVTTDLGEPDGDVHYKRKEPLGERIKLAALALAYGQKIEYSGPLYAGMHVQGDRAIITFTHLGGGLVAKDGPLTGFTIAGDDQKFFAADAIIQEDTVIVSSPSVSKPAAVRFGWADNPTDNLWNKAGLPAATFRTDDWPLPTSMPRN